MWGSFCLLTLWTSNALSNIAYNYFILFCVLITLEMTPRVPFYPKYNTLNKRLIKEIWLQFCYRAFRILRTLSNIVYFKFIWIPWYIKPRQKTLLHRQKGMGKKLLQLLGCSIGFSTFWKNERAKVAGRTIMGRGHSRHRAAPLWLAESGLLYRRIPSPPNPESPPSSFEWP